MLRRIGKELGQGDATVADQQVAAGTELAFEGGKAAQLRRHGTAFYFDGDESLSAFKDEIQPG
ncbi:hypothetical protein [Candidatus Accumulibacter vicinus]|uniref:hypothetical protein n=1 Tax=Candidatus Accumulibacter vicinus TaxID=2954382 RepID=UPI0004BBB5C6|nr:hypothetical protein [Candidatus Accumulibacter vicinus]